MSRLMDDVNGFTYIKGKKEIPNPTSIEKNRIPNLNYIDNENRKEQFNTLNYTKQFLNNQSPFTKIQVSPQGLSSGFTGHENLDVRKRVLGKSIDELHC